jgi:hypothetical protein
MKTLHSFVDHKAVPGVIAVLADALGGLPPGGGTRTARPEAATRAAAPAHPAGAWLRLDRWLQQRRLRDDEAFLAASYDVHDLERRMRRLEQGVGGRYY